MVIMMMMMIVQNIEGGRTVSLVHIKHAAVITLTYEGNSWGKVMTKGKIDLKCRRSSRATRQSMYV
jgi:hypothetical protein